MMVRELWTYGLVLGRRYWEERPAFVTLLTPVLGIVEVRLVWMGGRREAVFSQSSLEPMALSWFQLRLGLSGTSSESWEPVDLFNRLRADQPLTLLEIATLIQETVPLNEPVPELFRFSVKMLKRGNSVVGYPLNVRFTVGFLELLGYGIGQLVGGESGDLDRFAAEEPELVLSVCRGVLREALGVEL